LNSAGIILKRRPATDGARAGRARSVGMDDDTIDDLRRRMEAAAQAMDFEEAQRLRDRINLIRGGASREDAERADTSGLTRQTPGAMGLGTSQQRVTPPPGWKPPRKPDPMTHGHNRRRGRPS
jgi:hypothetical protein